MIDSRQTKPVTAVRRIIFCAGHRVYGHESKCQYLHGHEYKVFFYARAAAGLDALGRVIDFGVLKNRLGGWIEDNWDHGVILWKHDSEAASAVQSMEKHKLFLLPDNPTAENIATYLLLVVSPAVLTDTAVTVEKVVVWETENCFAEVELHEREQPDQATTIEC